MPIQNSRTYWENREKYKLENSLTDVNKLEKLLEKEYKKAIKNIENEIRLLYEKYGKDNNLSFYEVNKNLMSNEFKEWRMDLKDYMKLIEETGDSELLLELNTLAMRSRTSRLEEMLYQCDKHLNTLAFNQEKQIQLVFEETIKNTYYTDIFNNHKFIGVGTSFSIVDDKLIREVISVPFFGSNYSERIWRNRKKLQWVLKDRITNMVIQGKSSRLVARELATVMNNSYKNALRLVNSEHAHIMAQTTKISYKELNVEKYQYVSTLDRKTSKICQGLDMRVFYLSEASQGTNYPPCHANCRSTTVPYFEDGVDKIRFARNESDEAIEIPTNITYKEWLKLYNID